MGGVFGSCSAWGSKQEPGKKVFLGGLDATRKPQSTTVLHIWLITYKEKRGNVEILYFRLSTTNQKIMDVKPISSSFKFKKKLKRRSWLKLRKPN